MPLSFTLSRPLQESKDGRARRKVLVTGAAGRIGSYLVRPLERRYDLRLMVLGTEPKRAKLSRFGEVVEADLADLPRLKQVCQGVDTVLHLAANPNAMGVWSELLPSNVIGVYNMMVAAKSAGCRRLIFASSVHAISGYAADVQVKTTDPVNPGDLYGVTKCFGEALGRYMAEREGLSVIALRIGAFQPLKTTREHDSIRMMEQFVSPRDLRQLVERCIDDEKIQWALFHALSNNRFKKMDISDARELVGYEPQDDQTTQHPVLKKLKLQATVRAGNASDSDYESGLRDDLRH